MVQDLVIDTSALIQGFVTDTDSALVEILLEEVAVGEYILCIPDFCLSECANVLWQRVRRGDKSAANATNQLGDLLKLPFRVYTSADFVIEALNLGLQYQLAVYDSIYLAMCLQLNAPLVTVDKRQSNAAAAIGIPLKPLTDFTPANDTE